MAKNHQVTWELRNGAQNQHLHVVSHSLVSGAEREIGGHAAPEC